MNKIEQMERDMLYLMLRRRRCLDNKDYRAAQKVQEEFETLRKAYQKEIRHEN